MCSFSHANRVLAVSLGLTILVVCAGLRSRRRLAPVPRTERERHQPRHSVASGQVEPNGKSEVEAQAARPRILQPDRRRLPGLRHLLDGLRHGPRQRRRPEGSAATLDLPRSRYGQRALGPVGRAGVAGRSLQRQLHRARLRFAHPGFGRAARVRLFRQDRRAGLRSGGQETLANQRRYGVRHERLGLGFQPHPVQEPRHRDGLCRKPVAGGPGQADRPRTLAAAGRGFFRHLGHAHPRRLRQRADGPGDCRSLQDLGLQSRRRQAPLAMRGPLFQFDLFQRNGA